MNISEFFMKLFLIFATQNSNDDDNSKVKLDSSSIHDKSVPYTIYVEGNVGCGKSTFLDIFENDPRIETVPEPVAEWQNVSGSGIDMLELMFKNGSRWSGTFQLLSTYTRLKAALNITTTKPIRIMERSLFSERYCFVENAYNLNTLADVEYALSEAWFKLIKQQFWTEIKPDLIVYLRADLATLRKRIEKRGRAEEKNMVPGFLEGLQACHEDWLFYQNSSFPVPSRIVVLNSNLELRSFHRQVLQRWDEIVPKIF